jgi:hypothetical protein
LQTHYNNPKVLVLLKGWKTKENRGQNFTSEFGGGNNARHGQTVEPPINVDLLMAVTSSWMGEDIKFAKTWEEMIEKVPSRLKEGNEMVEKYKALKQKKELEEYIKKAYPGETNSGGGGNPDMTPSSQNNTPVKFDNAHSPKPKFKKGDIFHIPGQGNRQKLTDSTASMTWPLEKPIDTLRPGEKW